MGGVFVGLNSHITDGFDSVLSGVAATTGGWMAYLFSASTIALYITWRAYQTMAGKLTRPFEEIVWDVSRMLIIMIFVTNAGGYLDLVSDAISGLRDGLSGGTSIWERLDTVWVKAQDLGEKLYAYDTSKYVPLQGMFAEALVWIGVAFLVGVTAIINLIAELVMLLMLATAPIFIFCLMWSWFRDMFSNWLKTILGCILTSYFSGIALTVVMNYLDHILDGAKDASAANYVTLAVQIFLGTAGAAAVMLLMQKLAESLASASAQGATQAIASSGIKMGGSNASNVAGSIGDKAAENLKGNGGGGGNPHQPIRPAPGGSMESKRKAAIQRMQERYQR